MLTVFSGKEVASVKRFSVFDRWGEEVYYAENFTPHQGDNQPVEGWDGSMKGEMLNPAVFVYLAEVEFVTGEVKMIAGEVNLVR